MALTSTGCSWSSAEAGRPGQDPLERERLCALWQRSRSTTARAIGAVDVALWDLAGKIAGLPVHRLLGSYRDRVRAYASSAVLSSPEAYGDEAARFKADGWTAYKIHPPTDPDTAITVCQAVRRAVGDGFTVMLDGSWAYDYPAALRVGQAIEALGYHWYEDPLADDDLYTYVKLSNTSASPSWPQYSPGGFAAYAWLLARDGLPPGRRGDQGWDHGVREGRSPRRGLPHELQCTTAATRSTTWRTSHVIMAIGTAVLRGAAPAGAQKYGLIEDVEVDGQGLVPAPKRPGARGSATG